MPIRKKKRGGVSSIIEKYHGNFNQNLQSVVAPEENSSFTQNKQNVLIPTNSSNLTKNINLLSNSVWKDEEEYQPEYPNDYEVVILF